jgi:hypothetical protein
MNSKLKVLRVRDGSLLDEDSMRVLAEICAEHDFQCWIERVDGSGKVGFVISDGQVVSQPLAEHEHVGAAAEAESAAVN